MPPTETAASVPAAAQLHKSGDAVADRVIDRFVGELRKVADPVEQRLLVTNALARQERLFKEIANEERDPPKGWDAVRAAIVIEMLAQLQGLERPGAVEIVTAH